MKTFSLGFLIDFDCKLIYSLLFFIFKILIIHISKTFQNFLSCLVQGVFKISSAEGPRSRKK